MRIAIKRCFITLILCIASGNVDLSYADDAGKGIPSEAALRTKMALKLAGLVTFVAGSCPNLKADYPRFKTALNSLGLTYEDLSKTEMKGTYLRYTLRYKENVKENCSRALDQFGPNGKVVPDIFSVVEPR